jgi:hypothetical protein
VVVPPPNAKTKALTRKPPPLACQCQPLGMSALDKERELGCHLLAHLQHWLSKPARGTRSGRRHNPGPQNSSPQPRWQVRDARCEMRVDHLQTKTPNPTGILVPVSGVAASGLLPR